LQLPATNTAYCVVGFRGHRKSVAICGKFAAVSRRIWQTGHGIWKNVRRKTVVPNDHIVSNVRWWCPEM